MRRIVKPMVLLVLALAVPARALAALGADASSVARDREALKGALTVTPAVGYEIHELKISTGVVREYLAPGGLVFAVRGKAAGRPTCVSSSARISSAMRRRRGPIAPGITSSRLK